MHATVRSDTLGPVRASFAAAADASAKSSTHLYEIADAPVVLRFAGAELRDALSPAFAHLVAGREDERRTPALTVHLWDSISTGAPPPPLPAKPPEYPTGALVLSGDESLRCAYAPATDTLSILDLDSGVGWHWVNDVSAIPHWDRARPLRQMLSWWLQSRGYLQLHGSAVGTTQGGVLMVGKSGSGKSMTSLSILGSSSSTPLTIIARCGWTDSPASSACTAPERFTQRTA